MLVARAGVDSEPGDCSLCQPGTWSRGGGNKPCISCGGGYSTPEGAWSELQCTETHACPAGTKYKKNNTGAPFDLDEDCVCKPGFGGVPGTNRCQRCPAGTFAVGGDMEDCKSCPFGYTSDDGDVSCRVDKRPCPVGQWAPDDATSEEECRCYRGFGGECCLLLQMMTQQVFKHSLPSI